VYTRVTKPTHGGYEEREKKKGTLAWPKKNNVLVEMGDEYRRKYASEEKEDKQGRGSICGARRQLVRLSRLSVAPKRSTPSSTTEYDNLKPSVANRPTVYERKTKYAME
jgi:hypothetical protein